MIEFLSNMYKKVLDAQTPSIFQKGGSEANFLLTVTKKSQLVAKR